MYLDKSNLNVLFAVILYPIIIRDLQNAKKYLKKFYAQHKGKDKRFFGRYKLKSYYENTILSDSKHYPIELFIPKQNIF